MQFRVLVGVLSRRQREWEHQKTTQSRVGTLNRHVIAQVVYALTESFFNLHRFGVWHLPGFRMKAFKGFELGKTWQKSSSIRFRGIGATWKLYNGF